MDIERAGVPSAMEGGVLIASQPAVSRGWFVTGHILLVVSMGKVSIDHTVA